MASSKLHRSPELKQRQDELQQRIELFDQLVANPQSHTSKLPIRTIHLGDETLAISAARTLLLQGVYTSAIFFPAVAKGNAGLRVCMTASHTEEQIRKLGTTGLVIFERERTLLRQSSPTADLMLRNISAEFVELLVRLRQRNIRFGFISDDRGMNAGSYGQTEFEALSRLLDGMLNIRGAMPDFWIASRRIRIGSEAKKTLQDNPSNVYTRT